MSRPDTFPTPLGRIYYDPYYGYAYEGKYSDKGIYGSR